MKNVLGSGQKWKQAALVAGMIVWNVAHAVAGGTGGGTVSGALGNADTEVRSSFAPISRIMLAVMAVMGVVGAIAVYGKWSNGDPDTRKSAAQWFGALIFAGLVLIVIRAVFGVN